MRWFIWIALFFLALTACTKEIAKEKLYGRWERGHLIWSFNNNGVLVEWDRLYKTEHTWEVSYSNRQNYLIIDDSTVIPFMKVKKLLILDTEPDDGEQFVMKYLD